LQAVSASTDLGRTSLWTVPATSAGVRLDKFLAERGRCGSRARAVRALERGKVFVNGSEASVRDAGRPLADGDEVRLWMDRPGSTRPRPRTGRIGDLHTIYEDEALVAVNKPAGLLTVPLERKAGAPSVYEQIQDGLRSHGKQRPFVVHRIDQDTSGLVLLAKTARSQKALLAQFRRREPERIYLAVVQGRPDPPCGTWHDRLVWDTKALIQKPARAGDPAAAEAITDYRVIESLRHASLVEFRLRTGRRNQIRIQAALRGHALIGERRYGPVAAAIPFGRHALHAWRLVFRHPTDARRIELEAPLPPDFRDLLARLRSRMPARGDVGFQRR
jgi:23S rRNA pseudouridine1911/1915/1917 synthase